MAEQSSCPNCRRGPMDVFYEVAQAPTNSVLLLGTRQEALAFPRGEIALGHCAHCGFIGNTAFDPALTQYSARYEATQGYSPTFSAFHRRLAEDLIAQYDLHGKAIIEIGCDKGDFLTMLCELGDNRGVGFDPAYVPGRHTSSADLTFIADFYSEQYAAYRADFICCKMTLEHIPDTADFVGLVRRVIDDRPGPAGAPPIVFFQVPNAAYVFGDLAFWDVYYEHCSYFSLGALARLFRQEGFEVLDLWSAYEDQYLMIAARPGESAVGPTPPLPQENDLAAIAQAVTHFTTHCPPLRAQWRAEIERLHSQGQRIVLWGGGSKGVSFLTTLGLTEQIEYVVDINPHKAGTFMAGTGQEIVLPTFLTGYRPDVVIVMNPIYRDEIQRSLQALGLSPDLRTV